MYIANGRSFNVATHIWVVLRVRCCQFRIGIYSSRDLILVEVMTMKIKRILISAATGFAAFVIGFGAVMAVVAAGEILNGLSKPAATTNLTPVPIPETVSEPAIVTEPAPELEPVDEPAANESETEFYGGGWFYLDQEKTPKEFSDIENMEIVTHDFEKMDADGTPGVPIPPKGELKAKWSFRFSRISISEKAMSFKTETVNGVSYRFSGTYSSRYDYECGINGETPRLDGQLIKIKDGKWAASMKTNFYESCGC